MNRPLRGSIATTPEMRDLATAQHALDKARNALGYGEEGREDVADRLAGVVTMVRSVELRLRGGGEA